ncbi:peptide-methionine (S)-S-oxide reductase MsrA [Pediococcus cellicola]|uniref:Peptide methionine sulfoxide reductase MsrA n=1 Tax=Pediococcus cellicola TaxID=319652 RepID=A0A0R2IYT7_9LACO|nr:peptide-methionine (S)-S-oxide reductase MsrA [Pediococcus cellicola]KRN67050.1 peptide methionine sulfoxide reductase [Pediococcus cellicola]GEL15015.1 peptide methionine sulfoxide reductase MsrA [Pediococcus cellicola]
MQTDEQATLNDLYNLILNPATRDWERTQLLTMKNAVTQGVPYQQACDQLELALRPLAWRENLTPDVADFYAKITHNEASIPRFDITKHQNLTDPHYERAIFAGGCFWCMVEPFETRPGIISVLSGYTGGHTEHPTYDAVASQQTGHVEAVEIIFDTRAITYADLVDLYWQITDPTDNLGQINDRGNEYRPIIFVQNAHQRQIAETSKHKLAVSGKYKRPIVTEILPATTFWPAENYHQEFYKKHPVRYKRMAHARQQYLALQHLHGKLRVWLKKLGKQK